MDWGIGKFLIFVVVFIIVMLVIVYNVANLTNSIGLSTSNHSNTNTSTNNTNNVTTTTKASSYAQLETWVDAAAQKYVAKYYPRMLSGDDHVIFIRSLVSDGDIKSVNDLKTNTACGGYVVVYNNGTTNTYDTYLKCKNYTTSGYDDRYMQEY